MKADTRFLAQPPEFWANIRIISQEVGYTVRGADAVRVPRPSDVRVALTNLGLSTRYIEPAPGTLSPFGKSIFDYFEYRASVLNGTVRKALMNKDAAERVFRDLRQRLHPTCPLPMNKQKGDKKNYAFFTCIINMLVESAIGRCPCNYDPRSLTTVTNDSLPLRTLARRVDGAVPSIVDPVAIWEIKEYYYTKTFGSRVADGVYETLLDGMELGELERATGRNIEHVLFIDDHFTWWECGRSYLCRLIDMLHMGHVDEIIFGREVLTRLPVLAAGWAHRARAPAP